MTAFADNCGSTIWLIVELKTYYDKNTFKNMMIIIVLMMKSRVDNENDYCN